MDYFCNRPDSLSLGKKEFIIILYSMEGRKKNMIRTLVIDDEPFLRQYIKNSIVSQNPAFAIIGEAGNGEEAWQKITETAPDFIFIDI